MAACATHHASAALEGLGSAFCLGNCCGWKICCIVFALPVSLSALPAGDCREWACCSVPWVHCSMQVTACKAHSSKFASLSLTLPLRSAATRELCASVMDQHTSKRFHQKALSRWYVIFTCSHASLIYANSQQTIFRSNLLPYTFVLSQMTSHLYRGADLSSGSLCETSKWHLKFRSPLWAVRSA